MPARESEGVTRDVYEKALGMLEKYCNKYRLDLLILPESYIKMPVGYKERAWDLARRFSRILHERTGVNVVLGVGIEYGKSGKQRVTEYLYVLFSRKEFLYMKHAYTYRSAVDYSDWLSNWRKYLIQPLKRDGIRIGFSLCYDMYIGFIFAHYEDKVDLYINPSYSNVKYNKWAAMLQGRALENRVYTVCTLHHDKCSGGGKGYVFGYDVLGNPVTLYNCNDDKRYKPYETGGKDGLYYFTVSSDDIGWCRELEIYDVPAKKIEVDDYKFPKLRLSEGVKVKIEKGDVVLGDEKAYSIRKIEMNLDEFLAPGLATAKIIKELSIKGYGRIICIITGLESIRHNNLVLFYRLLRMRSLENRATFVLSFKDGYLVAAQPVTNYFQPKDSE
ncbi:MAG TPA: hypothetical protein ENF87_02725, partial [Thermoproteales archaeon]|nr:hypothetical protein [Thermoproteales archaeon]